MDLTLSEWTNEYEDEQENDSDDDSIHLHSFSELTDLRSHVDQDKCHYTQNLASNGGITILHGGNVRHAWERDGLHGLIGLFLTREMRDSIVEWTNDRLVQCGAPKITLSQFNAYIGLEIASSILQLNRLMDYWSTTGIYGNQVFKSTMSRDLFLEIRKCITTHPPNYATENEKLQDPLWSSRPILNQFIQKCSQIAVPRGVAALDKSSIRTKARTTAKTYIPIKPDKYAIRFYSLVDWKTLYVHGIFDNGAGNGTQKTHLERYTTLFPAIRRPMCAIALPKSETSIDPKSASALWAAMICHMYQLSVSSSGHRLVVTDSYYTRHALGKMIKSMANGEICMLGTCRMNYIDPLTQSTVERCVKDLQDAPCGTWRLISIIEKKA